MNCFLRFDGAEMTWELPFPLPLWAGQGDCIGKNRACFNHIGTKLMNAQLEYLHALASMHVVRS
jgi:hypothetical protein